MAIGTTAAIIGATAISTAGNIYAGSKQAEAQKRAAAVEAAAAREAAARLQPFTGAGMNALDKQLVLLGLGPDGDAGREAALAELQASPGYQFRLGQGTDVIERSAAARGGLFSGGTGRALTEFGQEFASNEFAKEFERLGGIARAGQSAAVGQGAAGVQAGQATAGGIRGASSAITSGVVGAANALTGGIESGLEQMRTNELLELLR